MNNELKITIKITVALTIFLPPNELLTSLIIVVFNRIGAVIRALAAATHHLPVHLDIQKHLSVTLTPQESTVGNALEVSVAVLSTQTEACTIHGILG